ncbi:MFS transporter [Lacipirellula sp.]|uniref:MFS transporter n=1 Tax=Lacipirellula sp. TaxID=2691419 RepID=UPI003D0EA7BD
MSRVAASPATRAMEFEYPPLATPARGLDRHPETHPGSARANEAATRDKLFYGWVMVPLATLVMISSAPGQTYGFMRFNSSIRESLSLSQTDLSAAYLLATLCAAVPLSFLGALSDRYGLKRSLLAAITAMAAACFYASTVSSGTTLFIACLGLRMVGAGLLSLLATNTLAAWFDKKLPSACGMMQFGMAASMALVPVSMMMLIDGIGWRSAYALLGVALMAVLLPLILFVYRERPSDVGQRMDGAPTPLPRGERSGEGFSVSATASNLRLVDEDNPPSMNLGEALRTRMFWLLLISTGVWSLIGTGLLFHLESLLKVHRLSFTQTAWATPLMAISMAIMQLGSSRLIDAFPIRYLISGALCCTALTCTILATAGGSIALVAYAVFGVGQGLMTVVSSASWAQYFGPAHLGRIRGTSMTVGISCSALGPLVMGASVDLLGGFNPSLWFFTTVAVTVAVGSRLLGATDAAPAFQANGATIDAA